MHLLKNVLFGQNSQRIYTLSRCNQFPMLQFPRLCGQCLENLQSSKLEIPLNEENQPKQYPQKLHNIVDNIAELRLYEVIELNELMKIKLKIPEASMMVAGPSQASAQSSEDENAQPQSVQTSFTVRLLKYNEEKKIALIKEVKNNIEGMNLVQAKKFIESLPAVLKSDISKDEAEKLRDTIQAAGGICGIE